MDSTEMSAELKKQGNIQDSIQVITKKLCWFLTSSTRVKTIC